MLSSTRMQVCHAWLARMRPLLARAAAAAGLHELAAYHATRRLADLQQQLEALLPPAATQARAAVGSTSDVGEAAAAAEAPGTSPASLSAQTPLGQQQQQLSAGGRSASDAANPAAALLAATRGSPDAALKQQQQPGSPSDRRRQLSPLQLQQAAGKAAEAAAVAATAMCALADGDAIAGLQAYCRKAFQPLVQHMLRRQQEAEAGTPGEAPAASDASSLKAGASAAWDWLTAVQLQAAGRYEAALQRYSELYGPAAKGGMQCVPAGALSRLVAEAYAAAGDAAGLQDWMQVRLARAVALLGHAANLAPVCSLLPG